VLDDPDELPLPLVLLPLPELPLPAPEDPPASLPGTNPPEFPLVSPHPSPAPTHVSKAPTIARRTIFQASRVGRPRLFDARLTSAPVYSKPPTAKRVPSADRRGRGEPTSRGRPAPRCEFPAKGRVVNW
jgi:hypothetical protein